MKTFDTIAQESRMDAACIKPYFCQARKLTRRIPGFRPLVYAEEQCSNSPTVGSLCKACDSSFTRASAMGEYYRFSYPGHGTWAGFITEEPHPTCRMFGTEWARDKQFSFDYRTLTCASPFFSIEFEINKEGAKSPVPSVLSEPPDTSGDEIWSMFQGLFLAWIFYFLSRESLWVPEKS